MNIKSNAQAEFTNMHNLMPRNFKTDLCISSVNELNSYCNFDLTTCPKEELEVAILDFLNSIVSSGLRLMIAKALIILLFKIDRTGNFYNFNWVQNVTEVTNLVVKSSETHRLVVNFDLIFLLRFTNRDTIKYLTFHDFRTKIEILFSFCDTWFSNFNINDATKV
jgi:hypothetical protein